jgi:hypothetical protein
MEFHEVWDINEYNREHVSISYISDIDGSEHFFFILANSSVNSDVLHFLNEITLKAQLYCRSYFFDDINFQVFCTTSHTFYEIPLNNKFNGVNKPKNVHKCLKTNVKVGPDGKHRAHQRYVMLVLQNKTKEEIKKLYVHEIAHTLANHVYYRVDDHKEDFVECEKKFLIILDQVGFDRKFSSVRLSDEEN